MPATITRPAVKTPQVRTRDWWESVASVAASAWDAAVAANLVKVTAVSCAILAPSPPGPSR